MSRAGRWAGFWEQQGFGRQPMRELKLSIDGVAIRGSGVDIVGLFTLTGQVTPGGGVVIIKQYVGQYAVVYQGDFDGEGMIAGRWNLGFDSGAFALWPERESHASAQFDEIRQIGE